MSPAMEEKVQIAVREYRKVQTLQRAVLVVAGALVMLACLGTADAVKRAQYESASASIYGTWVPMKRAVHPGDWIRFSHKGSTLKPNVVIFTVDGFKNVESGDQYPGVTSARITSPVKGVDLQFSVRRIPAGIPPGTYRLQGFAISQEKYRSNPSWYMSEPFKVTSDGKSTIKSDYGNGQVP